MCVPFMSMCCVKGMTCVSWCRWYIGVDRVHPVALLSAVFCVVRSFSMCVCAMSCASAVCDYVRMGLMNCLNSDVMSSLE